MKKKILLSLAIVAILVCLFAISVGAEKVSFNGQDITVTRITATAGEIASKLGNSEVNELKIMDEDAYVVLKGEDGKLYAFPSYYIIYLATGRKENCEPSEGYLAVSEIKYDFLNAHSTTVGTTFKSSSSVHTNETGYNGAIRYIEFPEGLTSMRCNNVFSSKGYERNIVELVIPASTKTIASEAFNAQKSLVRVNLKDNNDISYISGYAFTDSSNLTHLDFDKLTKLTYIDGLANCNFTGKVDLSKNTNLKSLPNSFLRNNVNVTEVVLPDSIETIGNEAFVGCTNMRFSSAYLPSNLVTIGYSFLSGCKNINDTLIFPEGFKTITDEGFGNISIADSANKEFNLVFLGEPTSLIIDGSSYTGWAKYVNVYFAKYTISDFTGNVYSYTDKASGTLGSKTSQTGKLVFDVASQSPTSTTKVLDNHMRFFFCGGNNTVQVSYMLTNAGTDITEDRGTFVMDGHTHMGILTVIKETCGADGSETLGCFICDKNIVTTLEATGNHTYVDGTCSVCGHSLCPGGANHVMKQTAVYPNGFINEGKIVDKCQNNGCTHEVEIEKLAPIFTFKGYSAKIGGDRITVGYDVSYTSLEKYEGLTGKKLNYGVVASLAQENANKPLSLSNGEITYAKNVVVAGVDAVYTGFDFILTGFTSDYYDKLLVMCAYVFDGESISYICSNNGVEGQYDSAYAISFNSEAK